MNKKFDCSDWIKKGISKNRDYDDVCIQALKKGIGGRIGTELCSLNEFVFDVPTIPSPAFLFNFYHRNLIPIYMSVTLMLIITAIAILGLGSSWNNPVMTKQNSCSPVICLLDPGRLPILHK